MSSYTDSLFGRIIKGFERPSGNVFWQKLVRLTAERAWEKAKDKEATSVGYEGIRATDYTLDGYDVGYGKGEVDPRLAKAINDESTPAPPTTPTRPDSLPDQLSHEAPAAAHAMIFIRSIREH